MTKQLKKASRASADFDEPVDIKAFPDLNPWHPMTDPVDLKTVGKLQEELGECTAAVARCIIQGIDEDHPETGKSNRLWLTEEIADVWAGFELTIERFGLDVDLIKKRARRKKIKLIGWHKMA